MILISRVREAVEFDENDEPLDLEGEFIVEDDPVSFRDLVWFMTQEGYSDPSNYPPSGSQFEWLSTHPETNYRTGAEEWETLHYSHKNPERKAKYWKKAMIYAGIIK